MPTPRLALLLLALAWLPIGSLAAQTDEPTTSDQPVASEPAGEANSAADASQPRSEQESPTNVPEWLLVTTFVIASKLVPA